MLTASTGQCWKRVMPTKSQQTCRESATKPATPLGSPSEEGGGHPAGPKIKPVKGRMSSLLEPTAIQ